MIPGLEPAFALFVALVLPDRRFGGGLDGAVR